MEDSTQYSYIIFILACMKARKEEASQVKGGTKKLFVIWNIPGKTHKEGKV